MITLSFCEHKESAISIEIPCLFTLKLIVWDPFPYENNIVSQREPAIEFY